MMEEYYKTMIGLIKWDEVAYGRYKNRVICAHPWPNSTNRNHINSETSGHLLPKGNQLCGSDYSKYIKRLWEIIKEIDDGE